MKTYRVFYKKGKNITARDVSAPDMRTAKFSVIKSVTGKVKVLDIVKVLL